MLGKWMRPLMVAGFALLTVGAEAQTSLGSVYGMSMHAMVQSRVEARVPHSRPQIEELFEDSLDQVLATWAVDRPVRLDLTVRRFPGVTQDGPSPQAVVFRLQPVDPATNRAIGLARNVRFKLQSGQQLALTRTDLVQQIASQLSSELATLKNRL
ncbi:hypothetical protein [Pseudaestuariivita sp.]|uniref:hypothetical protein n=1 Tax=Pseudaestuariivita sp. TaxID=2211669 RepID=UPI004058B940